MRKCNFCNVKIKDNTDHCPLCGGVLDGDEEGINTYPDVLKKEKAISLIFRLMLFIAIISVATCIGVNVTTGVSTAWSLIVTFAFSYVLLILYMFVKENAGYRVRVFGIVAAGIVLVIVIDYILGFTRWSVNYVFPACIILVDLTFLILMFVNHRNWQSYILILLVMILISLIPVLLYKLNIITVPYMAQISLGVCIIIALGVLILGGPRVKSELYRRFHILGK